MWKDWTKRYFALLEGRDCNGKQNFETSCSARQQAINLLTEEVEKLHNDVNNVVRDFSKCSHNGTAPTSFPCNPCAKNLEKQGKKLEAQNIVVYELISEIVQVGRTAPMLSRTACSIINTVLSAKMKVFRRFKTEAALHMDNSVSTYWRKYGRLAYNGNGLTTFELKEHSFVFPGRSMVRPAIKTDMKDKADCTKKYFTSRPNITSFISLQCSCAHPKVIRFTLLKEVESIAMAISTIISFLYIHPRAVWYDNARNLYDSALIRPPFLPRSCRLMVDRFHFQGHTCSNHYNPDRYTALM